MFAFSALRPPPACYSALSAQPTSSHESQPLAHSLTAHRQQRGLLIPAAMEIKGGGWQNAVIGPVLQCLEAATLGMPLEVCGRLSLHIVRTDKADVMADRNVIYASGARYVEKCA